MNLNEKINYLSTNHSLEWRCERQKQWDLLSNSNHLFCFCGKLATGFHEINCKKFQNAIDKRTVKALKHLIQK